MRNKTKQNKTKQRQHETVNMLPLLFIHHAFVTQRHASFLSTPGCQVPIFSCFLESFLFSPKYPFKRTSYFSYFLVHGVQRMKILCQSVRRLGKEAKARTGLYPKNSPAKV